MCDPIPEGEKYCPPNPVQQVSWYFQQRFVAMIPVFVVFASWGLPKIFSNTGGADFGSAVDLVMHSRNSAAPPPPPRPSHPPYNVTIIPVQRSHMPWRAAVHIRPRVVLPSSPREMGALPGQAYPALLEYIVDDEKI